MLQNFVCHRWLSSTASPITYQENKDDWIVHGKGNNYKLLYHSNQACPIDLNILHSELFHDEIFMASRALHVRLHNAHVPMCVAQSAARGTVE